MGQYYLVCNLDKRQFLHPHRFGDGLKLLEFGSGANGTLLGLAVLLADGNNRGGGDLRSDDPVIGSWAGDRIVVAGDYGDPRKFIPEDTPEDELQAAADATFTEGYRQRPVNLYALAQARWEDVSDRVLVALCADPYLRGELQLTLRPRLPGGYMAESYPVPPELFAALTPTPKE